MHSLFANRTIFLFALFCAIWTLPLRGEGIRTYNFVVGDVTTYFLSPGFVYPIRGKIQGSFDVSLDFDNGIGTLLSLDATIVEREQFTWTDISIPPIWVPIDGEQPFLPPDYFSDIYRPPFQGVLEPAVYKPLGPGTASGTQSPEPTVEWLPNGVGFTDAPPGSWQLSFGGRVPTEDGRGYYIASMFYIYLEDNEASFSFAVPVSDAAEYITAATALRVPEPSSLFCASCLVMGVAAVGARRFATLCL